MQPRNMTNSHKTPTNPIWAIVLGSFIFIIGLWVSNGHFQSVDESAMYVAASNLIKEGVPHTNQMGYSLWAIRAGEAVNSLAPDGNLYTKKSPLMILLLTPLIMIANTFSFDPIRTVLWIGPLLTAATAVLLIILAQKLGYTRTTATILTLIYAFATMALPYSQTIFGEVTATFGLTLTLFALIHQLGAQEAKARYAFLCGVGVTLAIGANAVYIVVAIICGIALLILGLRHANYKQVLQNLILFAIPIGLLILGILGYNHIRFGDWLNTGYNFAPQQEGFTTPLWWGMFGLLFSPARGLFWYSIPVLLGFFGLQKFYRAQRPLTWLMLVTILVQIIIFSLWWEWWGGYGWGPRFLLPTVPYFLILALPFIATAVHGNRTAQIIIGLSVLGGLLVQIAGTAVDVNTYEQYLDANFPAPQDQPLRYHHNPQLVTNVAQSPIFEHWRQILAGNMVNTATTTDISQLTAVIQQQQKAEDTILFVEPNLLYEMVEANNLPPSYGLPYNITDQDERAQTLFKTSIKNAERIWLISWYPPGDPGNWYESQLRETWAVISDQWLGEYRLLLFASLPETAVFPANRYPIRQHHPNRIQHRSSR